VKAVEIREHFLSVADWVDPEKTVDRIIVGDPQRDIHRVLVTWISSFAAVRHAAERGYDMLITHEPTFWEHRNDYPGMEQFPAGSLRHELGLRKLKAIEDARLVILRIHDVWDRMPQVGIPWAWARFLGMGTTPAAVGGNGYQHRYDIEPLALEALARRVAAKTAGIGEPFVQVVGDGGRVVSKVGIGTGCGCDFVTFVEMGCDVSIVCDDGSCYWSNLQVAADIEHPVIRVNHGTSEEPGMVTLTRYVNDTFPDVTADHLPHGSSFRLVGA
jgi:putative NIF3 family GTP cyclohydrolase 1 type 2